MRPRRPGGAPRYTVRLAAYVSYPAREALEELAEQQDRRISELVRDALAEYLGADQAARHDHSPIGTPPWTQVNVMVRPEVRRAIAEIGDRQGQPSSVVARAAIDRYLRRADAPVPDEAPSLLTA